MCATISGQQAFRVTVTKAIKTVIYLHTNNITYSLRVNMEQCLWREFREGKGFDHSGNTHTLNNTLEVIMFECRTNTGSEEVN